MASKNNDLLGLFRSKDPNRELNSLLHDGRRLVQDARVQQPKNGGSFNFDRWRVTTRSAVQNLTQGEWSDLHFRHCDVSNVNFFNCRFTNCVFEACNCRGVGFWESIVNDCQFLNCDLREAVPGGIDKNEPEPNQFKHVRFEGSDLRDTSHSCELYSGCQFVECNLDEVDLLGAVFEDTVFMGNLHDLTFRDSDPRFQALKRNDLKGCDFTKADVSTCQFLNIDINPASFAPDPDLIILPHGPQTWKQWADAIESVRNEGKSWFISRMISLSGTPSIVSKTLLLGGFSIEEVKVLANIAGGVE